MPFVPALNTVRLAINYLSETGETGTNVQYFRNADGAFGPSDMQTLINTVKVWQAASWANVASEDWQTDLYVATDMTTEGGAQVTDIETIPGLLTSPALPAQNTIAISTRTGFTGRSRRGRLFHVGLSEVQVIGSRVVLSAADNLILAYNALRTALDATSWQWVVASFVSNGAPRATALLTTITNVILTDTVVDSMDTRKPTGA